MASRVSKNPVDNVQLLGLCALNVALIVVGLALLAGVGLVREPRPARCACSDSPTSSVGRRLVSCSRSVSSSASRSEHREIARRVCDIPTLAGLAGARFSPPAQLQPVLRANRSSNRLAGGIAVAAISIWALLQLGRVVTMGASYHQDTWGFWLPRAKSLVLFDGLDTGLAGFTSFAHPEYPPLVPAMDAVAFRFMDVLDPTLLPFQEWVLAIAFIGALAGLLAGVVRGWILWPCLAFLCSCRSSRSISVPRSPTSAWRSWSRSPVFFCRSGSPGTCATRPSSSRRSCCPRQR